MPRIMLVDDEYSVLSSLRRCIHLMPKNSFQGEVIVESFERAELALQRAGECRFDLVMCDWRMPQMDGIEFLTRLIRIQPDIARIVLSAHTEFRLQTEAIKRLQLFQFISKPWNNQILCVLMRLALEQREQAGDRAQTAAMSAPRPVTEPDREPQANREPLPAALRTPTRAQRHTPSPTRRIAYDFTALGVEPTAALRPRHGYWF